MKRRSNDSNGMQSTPAARQATEAATEERTRSKTTGSIKWDERDLSVLLVGPSGTGGIGQYITQQSERLQSSVTVHDTKAPSSGQGTIRFIRGVLIGFLAMVRFLIRDKPDLVHIHSSHRFSFYRASFYALFSRYIWQVPVVLHIHGSSFDEFVSGAGIHVALLQRTVFSACDRIIVLSEYWRDILSLRAPDWKLRVVPNAIDPELFYVDDEGQIPHIVFVSNLVERKGVSELVSALDSLKELTDCQFTATLAGDGPLADEVENLTSRHDKIQYLGYVTEEEKREVLGAGSIFVLPTYAEGLPIAMLEGMAGGNAIISTTVGSIPEVIDDDQGILIPPGDVSELQNALAELVDSPDRCKKMGSHNRQLVESEHSWTAAIDDITGIYRTVLIS